MLGTSLDVRRFDTLVHAGPMDYRGVVQEVPNEDVDFNTTIFHTVTDPNLIERLKKRFGQRPLWPDSVIHKACAKAVHLPPQQYFVPPPIWQFMMDHCEFKNEHAEGGFNDHLEFCAEYCARYFPQGSPNVLYLHSICGVNTNLFPLEFDKIPEMQAFLTEHEYLHVQAFPGMLRLLFMQLLDDLWDQSNINGITIQTFHGTQLTLEGDEFWNHLNFQLIHQLDFNPTCNFDHFAMVDGFTRLFFRLHEFLRKNDKLLADVRLDRIGQIPGMSAENEDVPTWEHMLSKVNPEEPAFVHGQLITQLRKYSEAIDHDLSYEMHFQ